MLGTEKKQLAENDVAENLLEAVNIINSNEAIDVEEKFLQTAALSFNYRQAGAKPLQQTIIDMPVAAGEEKTYCNAVAVQALKDIFYEESFGLLKMWLQLCATKHQVVPPVLVPALLEKGVQYKQLKSLVQECAGNRGVWLSQFNNDWTFTKETNDEALWQTGNPEERKTILQKLRSVDAAKALEWLQETWQQENANSKAELLRILSTGLSVNDVAWLETLATEKSHKVKDEALRLLKRIPESTIVQSYMQLLQQTVSVKKERLLLGLSSKTILYFELPPVVDENIFKSGIEKLSSNKEFTDDEFIVYQLMQFVPPTFWENQLSLLPGEIIHLFQKHDAKKKFIPALAAAAQQFNDVQWASVIMEAADDFYPGLLPLLTDAGREQYSIKFFKGYEDVVIGNAVKRNTEWGSQLTVTIFQFTATHPYNYNRIFYSQHIHLIPVDILKVIDACKPADEYEQEVWNKNVEHITRLIHLKTQTIKAFQ